MLKAHKIRLNPTEQQEQYFWKAAGIARYCYNWGLARYNQILDYNRENPENKQSVSGRLLKKEFNTLKPEWVNDVTTWASQGAFDDLQKAFSNFWKKNKDKTLPKANKPRKDKRPNGWPRFKSRNRSIPAFYLANISLQFNNHSFMFDKKRCGWINMTEPLRFDGKVMGARVTYKSGHWWLSVQVEVEQKIKEHNQDIVGIDLGIKYLAVTSDGVIYDNPKAYIQAQRKLRRLQRKLDRQNRANNPQNYNENGTCKQNPQQWIKSNRMKVTEEKISKLHFRVANIRNETTHKMTTELSRQYGVIAIEDLNVKGMMQNGKLSKALADASLFEKRRQLEYKANWNGGTVVTVDRWFPSSKMCSNCSEINTELTLSDRQWECSNCGSINHRDGNAAINIKNECYRILNSPEYLHGEYKRTIVNS